MTECQQIQRWISAMVDGELDDERKGSVLAHLAQCEQCRAFLETLETVQDQLHKAVQNVDTGALDARFFETLTRERQAKPRWWQVRVSVPLPVAGAALLALLVALVLALRAPVRHQTPSTPSYAAVRTVVIGPEDVVKQVHSPL